MSWIESHFPTLAKHGQVLREAWLRENEAAKAFKPKDEHDFLPAALEIMEKPASPGLRWLLLLTCGLFVLALVWAFLGKIDVVATAAGKTVPNGNVKIVQPIEIGSVRAIHVKNGQFVKKGDLLIELDPTMANAEEAQSSQTLLSAQVTRARNDALLAHLQGRPATFVPPAGTPHEMARTEQAYVDNAVAQFQAQSASLAQQRAENAAQLAASNAEIAKLREAVPYIDQQMSARAELAEKGFYSKLKLLEYEQMKAEHLRNIEIQQAIAARARASIGRLDAEIRALRASFGKTAVTELAEASQRASIAGEEVRKAERRRALQELRAPVDGVIQQLAVTTIGGVVQPAQALMVIVPCDSDNVGSGCRSGLAVEAFVQNKDVGFVKIGQRVAVKLEAFNFTDYGLIDGTVTNISRDAIDQSHEPVGSLRDDSGRVVQPGLVYATRIELSCGARAEVSDTLCSRVQPGMAVQAEIKTGKRRIIQYFLSPISQALDEAGRER